MTPTTEHSSITGANSARTVRDDGSSVVVIERADGTVVTVEHHGPGFHTDHPGTQAVLDLVSVPRGSAAAGVIAARNDARLRALAHGAAQVSKFAALGEALAAPVAATITRNQELADALLSQRNVTEWSKYASLALDASMTDALQRLRDAQVEELCRPTLDAMRCATIVAESKVAELRDLGERLHRATQAAQGIRERDARRDALSALRRAQVRLANLDHRATGLRQRHALAVGLVLDLEGSESEALTLLRALGGDRHALQEARELHTRGNGIAGHVVHLCDAETAHRREITREAAATHRLTLTVHSQTAAHRSRGGTRGTRRRPPAHLTPLRQAVQRCAP